MVALKNFGITFLISILVFGITAYFVSGFFTSTVNGILDKENDRLDQLFTEAVDQTSTEDEGNEDILPEVKGDSFTVLFGVTDHRDGDFDYFPEDEKAISKIETDDKKSVGLLVKDYRTVKVKSIVLMRVCKETREYNFISIPSTSKVYTQMGGGYTLLEDVMYFYDQDYFVQKVAAMTGITPDYTVFVNITDLDDVLTQTGGFTCHVPEDIYTDGKDFFPEPPEETTGEETTAPETKTSEKDKDKGKDKDKKDEEKEPEEEKVVLEKVVSAGNITVGASNIEALLLYEGYEGGISTRSEVLVDIVEGFVKKLSDMDDGALSRVYTNLTKKDKITTNMTESQLLSKGDLLRAFGNFKSDAPVYPGAMNGELFVPDIMAAVRQYLGLRIPSDPAKAS